MKNKKDLKILAKAYKHVSTPEAFRKWVNETFHPKVAEYLIINPQDISLGPKIMNSIIPNPKAWESVSDILKFTEKHLDIDIIKLRNILASNIGIATATKFCNFITNDRYEIIDPI